MSSGVPRVNATEEAATDGFSRFVAPSKPPTLNPIDEYLDETAKMIISSAGATEDLLRLYLLGLISSAERCFRRLLAGVLSVCDLATETAGKQQLSLAATSYFASDLGHGLLEHAALSGEGELKKRTRALVGLTIQDGSSLDHALVEFEKLCQLRHAAVHSGGDLSARNVLELALPLSERLSLAISALAFQSLVLRCHNAVRAYNQFLFSGVVQRWIDKAVLTGEWSRDAAKFSSCYRLFASTREMGIEQDPKKAYAGIAELVRSRNGQESSPRARAKKQTPLKPAP